MIIGLWNIDCPKSNSTRFLEIKNYLLTQDCDILILTEVNSALHFENYHSIFSDKSPFISKNRNYEFPNTYHQVGIYSKIPLKKHEIKEPINGLLCEIMWNKPFLIYGNVITIKDRWAKWSNLKYSDRLDEQIEMMKAISNQRCFIGGDFNCRFDKSYNKIGYKRLTEFVNENDLNWQTKTEVQTVQQILHSNHFQSNYSIDNVVKPQLSDHPFMKVELI